MKKYQKYAVELLTNDDEVEQVEVNHLTSLNYKKMLEVYRKAKEQFANQNYQFIALVGYKNHKPTNIYSKTIN